MDILLSLVQISVCFIFSHCQLTVAPTDSSKEGLANATLALLVLVAVKTTGAHLSGRPTHALTAWVTRM